MDKRLILGLTLRLTLLDWVLFFLLFFCFDHSIGAPPPGLIQLAMARALQVLAFPMTLFAAWHGMNPPIWYVSTLVLFPVGALVWAVVFERTRWLFRGISSRDARDESMDHNS
jgi:hypothetical protein